MKYETVADIIAERDALKARLAEDQEIYHQVYMVLMHAGTDKYLGALEQAQALVARLAEAERENERLRKELRHPKGCTYDSEGKPLTICHELATLRSEADRVHKEHAEMIDGYEAKLEEYERRIEELTEALGFEEVPALSPTAQQAFRAAVQEIDGVNLRRVKELEARLADAVKALQAIADYPPGTFRPLADEIAIWRIATDAIDAARAADSADATAATPEGE